MTSAQEAMLGKLHSEKYNGGLLGPSPGLNFKAYEKRSNYEVFFVCLFVCFYHVKPY